MTTTEHKTFNGWRVEGRVVRRGEKAAFYGICEGDHSYPLFTLKQTDEIPTEQEFVRIVPAEERPATKRDQRQSAGSKILVDYYTDSQTIQIWVGPNRDAIKFIKGVRGYWFNGVTHRWTATRDTVEHTAKGLVAYAKKHGLTWNVVVKVDGEPYACTD